VAAHPEDDRGSVRRVGGPLLTEHPDNPEVSAAALATGSAAISIGSIEAPAKARASMVAGVIRAGMGVSDSLADLRSPICRLPPLASSMPDTWSRGGSIN
jgi:hypothetical protein